MENQKFYAGKMESEIEKFKTWTSKVNAAHLLNDGAYFKTAIKHQFTNCTKKKTITLCKSINLKNIKL